MNQLYVAKFDKILESEKEFYELAKQVNPTLTSEQFRGTLRDCSRINWPYSGSKYCKNCGGDIWKPYFYEENVTPKEFWQEDGITPKHNCEPTTIDRETGEKLNSTGMPIAHQHITIDPIIP